MAGALGATGAALHSSSPNRLPTVSASQALQNVKENASLPILTGLETLDSDLRGSNYETPHYQGNPGGLPRGRLIEIFGPPGAGKTSICLQACASALLAKSSVVWMDAGHQVPVVRLARLLNVNESAPSHRTLLEPGNDLHRFKHYMVPTLPHLLALLASEKYSFLPADTSLIVLESISSLFDNAFPRDSNKYSAANISENSWRRGSHRQTIIGDVAVKLSKLAAIKNVPLILTSNMTTKVRHDTHAVLRSAMAGQEWESAISTRILLYRDWPPPKEEIEGSIVMDLNSVRYVQVLKTGGVENLGREHGRRVIPFIIETTRLRELPIKLNQKLPSSSRDDALLLRSNKRPYDEIADSDADNSDSEYGWTDEDGHQLSTEGLVDEAALAAAAQSGLEATATITSGEAVKNGARETEDNKAVLAVPDAAADADAVYDDE